MNNNMELTALLDFAKEIAKRSGDMIVTRGSTSMQVSPKGENDFVTEVDFASQELIVNLIQQKYPNHGFLAEESTPNVPRPQKYTWVVDPIDGTVNYIRQRPLYCVSLGLLIDNKPQIGVIYDPVNKEMFSAASGHGFYINDRQFKENTRVNSLHDAAVGLDWDTSRSLRLKANEKIGSLITNVQTIPIIGSVALALAWIASGRIDAYFKYEVHAWDIAAAAVMIQETSGRISHHNNDNWDWRSKDKSLLASNGLLHDSLLAYFQ